MYRVMERATWGPHVALATAQRLAGDDDQVVTPAGSCAHVRDVVRGVLECVWGGWVSAMVCGTGI